MTGVQTCALPICASDGFAAIGAIDSPVIKDALTRKPYIPGSSLKGKMRSLLAKAYNENRMVRTRDEDDEKITRLFGGSADRKSRNPKPSRLIFSDTIISNYKELKDLGVSEVEAKEENSIDPLTAEANPRQIERVIRGAEFPLNIIYNLDSMRSPPPMPSPRVSSCWPRPATTVRSLTSCLDTFERREVCYSYRGGDREDRMFLHARLRPA